MGIQTQLAVLGYIAKMMPLKYGRTNQPVLVFLIGQRITLTHTVASSRSRYLPAVLFDPGAEIAESVFQVGDRIAAIGELQRRPSSPGDGRTEVDELKVSKLLHDVAQASLVRP